jgi:hypothetical protein
MFELVILSVIFFAAAYAAFLWKEGRRDDVLFGAFVEKSPPIGSTKSTDAPQKGFALKGAASGAAAVYAGDASRRTHAPVRAATASHGHNTLHFKMRGLSRRAVRAAVTGATDTRRRRGR